MITNIALQQIIVDTTNISLTFTTNLNDVYYETKRRKLQVSSLVLALHLSLHLCLCKPFLTLLLLLHKFRILSYTKHRAIFTASGWAVVTSCTHIARYDLLVSKECTATVFCLVSRTTSFSLIDKSCFEVNILVTSFNLESLQLIVWNVMDTVNRTSLNSHCNSFVIISPLLELSATCKRVL